MTELPTPDEADPEGPGGYVTDPPSESYDELVKQLDAQRKARSITFNWTERERMMYSCRATIDREAFQHWLDKGGYMEKVDEVAAETVVTYLEANPGAASNERRWPADESEIDYLDLTIVQP